MRVTGGVWLGMIAAGVIGMAGWQTSTAPAQSQAKSAAPVLAEDVYNNIQVLKGQPAESVIPTMLQIRHAVGVDCEYCHVPHEWARDDKAPKQNTRRMFEVLGFVIKSYTDEKLPASCWMCHRGHNIPERLRPDPEAVGRMTQMIAVAPADRDKPAEKVFMNIEMLQGVPAGSIPQVMTDVSRALGVRCSHCHVPDHWEADTRLEKRTARSMITLTKAINDKFYDGRPQVTCFTCHHGQQTPDTAEGKAAD